MIAGVDAAPSLAGALLDVDRTLTYRDEFGLEVVTQRVARAVRAVQELVPVMPVTGRSAHLMQDIVRRTELRDATGRPVAGTGLRGLATLDNGASVYHLASGQYISQRWLSADTVRAVVLGVKAHCSQISFREIYDPRVPATIDACESIQRAPSIFADFSSAEAGSIEDALQGLRAEHPIGWQVMHGEDNDLCVQVTQAGVDKASGLHLMLAHAGLQGAAMLAVGDNKNDEPLLQAVGPGSARVAMGDAPTELKALADFIAPTVECDGLAVALERYFPIPKESA